jgi:hypothetical protein
VIRSHVIPMSSGPEHEWTAATPVELANAWMQAAIDEDRRELENLRDAAVADKKFWIALLGSLFAASMFLHVVLAVVRYGS